MENKNNTTLFVPIQINGGDNNNAPVNLLDRELFVIKNGTLYVGIEDDGKITIGPVKGNVIPGATLAGVNLSDSLFIKNKAGLVLTKEEFNSDRNSLAQSGRVIFIDEGQY